MCGRFVQQIPPARVGEMFDVDPALAALPNAPPRYNAAPTQDLMVVRRHPETGARHLSLLKWGLVPSFAKDTSGGARLINARAETAPEKLSFRALGGPGAAASCRRTASMNGCARPATASPFSSAAPTADPWRWRDCGRAGRTRRPASGYAPLLF